MTYPGLNALSGQSRIVGDGWVCNEPRHDLVLACRRQKGNGDVLSRGCIATSAQATYSVAALADHKEPVAKER